jgi:tubulin--tyrosine ligase-like protein 12
MEEFMAKHALQLYGIGFPSSLQAELYSKLSAEQLDMAEFFCLNQELDADQQVVSQELTATRHLDPFQHVFLVDHAWTFRFSSMRTTLKAKPELLARMKALTKTSAIKRDLPGAADEEVAWVGNLELDEQGLRELPAIPEDIVMLSLWGNLFESLDQLASVLPQLKAIWLNDNPICDNEENTWRLFEQVEGHHPNIEVLNSKFTRNAGAWALQFVSHCPDLESITHLDLSDRDFMRADPHLLELMPRLTTLNIKGNVIADTELLHQVLSSARVKGLEVDEDLADFFWAHPLPHLRYLNGYDVLKGKPSEADLVAHDLMKLVGSYRLATEEKMDESNVWYVMDELGCSILHSDEPNVRVCPFLYQTSEAMVAYALVWPIKSIKQGHAVYRDYLHGVTEAQFRSTRLGVWFNLPSDFFLAQQQLWEASLGTYPASVPRDEPELAPIEGTLKLWTDLDYFSESLTDPRFALSNIEEADVVWSRSQVIEGGLWIASLKETQFIQQFPYETCLVLKNKLAQLVQKTRGPVSWMQRTFDITTELPAFVGEYLKRKAECRDNHWILKPTNLSRGMDAVVTDDLDVVLRQCEGGPKVVQKYIHKPLLLSEMKFDLRFIILLRSIRPLNMYVYRRFWVRSANDPFNLSHEQSEAYETHFTVMNYGASRMQTIMDYQFAERMTAQGIDWPTVLESIYEMFREVFTCAALATPEMQCSRSRAMYGMDVMLDSKCRPKLLEVNFCPDCTRATKQFPTFTNDVFGCLFYGGSDNVVRLI